MTPIKDYMSKDGSVRLKGIAIMIMVYLHCFLKQDIHCVPMTTVLEPNGDYLWLHNFCNICVPLYMLLSGYGIYVTKCDRYIINQRILRLLETAFLIGLLWYPLSYFNNSLNWTFGNGEFLSCIVGYNPYNGEWWFIAPWIMLTFLSKEILFLVHKNRLLFFLLIIISYVVGKYIAHTDLITQFRSVQILSSTLICLLSYGLGALLASYKDILIKVKLNKILAVIAILLLIVFRCSFISNGFLDPFIALIFVCLLCNSQILEEKCYINNGLTMLGKQSTYIWLIHTFICCYYLHDYLFIMKYPIMIYIVLLVLSYIISLLNSHINQTLVSVLAKHYKRIQDENS